ncbi:MULTISPECIES: helix-turn-helix transcriptional regulator [unclassified Streptomyces]|uniref:helix-turn-helix transcriptional regulator n=1 Tax=unclassified Streptomyces TaxID=2593676 RepID=UPI002DDA186E|nr:helix-turn-helix transcriptional regulator [Streptomyces sp. NBC_00243]WRZ23976.1 helix-turn-helix domain-containing protein [Streptomyces sp. NBC_00243]
MLEQSHPFGAELRRLRLSAGLTLAQLASSVHYSKGQLSKIETGLKRPTVEFARLCDAELNTNGALAALVPASAPPTRRHVIAVGAASVLSASLIDQPPPSATVQLAPPTAVADQPAQSADIAGETLIDASRTLLDQYRRIGQLSAPEVLAPAVVQQTHALRSLASQTGSRTGRELLGLAARFAEYTGWLAQEAGDERAALRWTAHAVDLAEASGDRDLASYALVRRALITYYRGEAADTVALAEGASSDRLPPRIRGLAAQREAQGHALAGDHDACLRGLDRARELLALDTTAPADAPVLGTTNLSDPVSMITGWCLFDLGRPRAAADALDRACARLPEHAWRTQARYGVRRALAYAVAGEIDHACELAGPVLHLASGVRSATVATDLRRLSRTLSRHPRNRSYLAIAPRLTAILAPAH